MTAGTLRRNDFWRTPIQGPTRPATYKEWHHFVVQAADLRLVVNFSLMNEVGRGTVPRIIVIVHSDEWRGVLEQRPDIAHSISADLRTVEIGNSRVELGDDMYRVSVDLPEPEIACELAITPTSRPFVVNNQPLGAGRLSWLFVPRLRATGHLHAGGRTWRLSEAPAYHDHNWGGFRWGDDFGWEWGSILPTADGVDWSVVVMRMTDRHGFRATSQALYLWRGDEPAAMFRDATVTARSSGPLDRPADATLPPAMQVLLGSRFSDIPARHVVSARRGNDHVQVDFRPGAYARIARPSEVDADGAVVLNEAFGPASVAGIIAGEPVEFVAPAVFEFLHG